MSAGRATARRGSPIAAQDLAVRQGLERGLADGGAPAVELALTDDSGPG